MTKYKFYNFYFRLNCDQIEADFTLYFQNILNITNFGNNLNFPSNFLCSSRISFKLFPSKFISFKFPSFCKKFLSKGNFLQSGSAEFFLIYYRQRIVSLANQNSARDLSEPIAFRYWYRSCTRDICKISTSKCLGE